MTTVAGPRDAALDEGRFTRRRFLAGLSGGLAIAMGLPAAARGQAMTGTFTGPNLGLAVAWDESVWQLLFSSLDSPPDPHDWMTMGPVQLPPGAAPESASWTLFRTEIAEEPFADIAAAKRDAYRQYLDDTDSSEDFTELVDTWASGDAVGLLMVQRFYDYDPWIYHEYATTTVPGQWRRTTITIPAANIEPGYVTMLLNAITVDGGPPFLAGSTDQVVAAMTQTAAGVSSLTSTSTQPQVEVGQSAAPGEWVSQLNGHRVTWQPDLFEQPEVTSIPTTGTDLVSIYLAGVSPREFVSLQITPRFGPSSFASPQEAESYLTSSYFDDIAYPAGTATTVWTASNDRAAGMLYYTPELDHGTCAYGEYQAPRLPNTPWIALTYSMQFGAFDDAVTGRALATFRINDEPAFLASPIEHVLKDIAGIQAAVLA